MDSRTEIQAIKLVLLDGKSPFPNESLVGQGLKDGKYILVYFSEKEKSYREKPMFKKHDH